MFLVSSSIPSPLPLSRQRDREFSFFTPPLPLAREGWGEGKSFNSIYAA